METKNKIIIVLAIVSFIAIGYIVQVQVGSYLNSRDIKNQELGFESVFYKAYSSGNVQWQYNQTTLLILVPYQQQSQGAGK